MTAGVRALATAVLTAASLVCLAPPASADHTLQDLVSPPGAAPYAWDALHMSPDGQRVIFGTLEPFDAADTDTRFDLYEQVGETFSLLTPGTNEGGPYGVSQDYVFSLDGSHVLFQTTDALVPADQDITRDVYETFAGGTTLVSVGDLPSNGLFDATVRDVSDDGARVYFTTEEKLVAQDTDGGYVDVYERSPAGTRLVSAGGSGEFDVTFQGASGIGSVVVFSTQEQLEAADTDNEGDLYADSGGASELVSTGPTSSAGGNAALRALSRNGDRVVFTTSERLVPEDADGFGMDLYARAGGATTLISTGPTSTNAGTSATFVSASEDATAVVFSTEEHLTADHTWTGIGYYRRSGSTTDLVVPKQLGNHFVRGLSGDGSHVFYHTHTKVLPEDVDPTIDVYQWHAGVTTRVTTGPQDNEWENHGFAGASFDGERVFFVTRARLLPEDASADYDLYERFAGQTYLLTSTGGIPGPEGPGVAGISPDGTVVLVTTRQSLDPADTDGGPTDAYLYEAPTQSLSFWQLGRADNFTGNAP